MVSTLGWYVTKHSIGLYSTAPLERGFTRVDSARTQANVDALPGRGAGRRLFGPATVEATGGRVRARGRAGRRDHLDDPPDGRRALANTRDSAVMQDMTEKRGKAGGSHCVPTAPSIRSTRDQRRFPQRFHEVTSSIGWRFAGLKSPPV